MRVETQLHRCRLPTTERWQSISRAAHVGHTTASVSAEAHPWQREHWTAAVSYKLLRVPGLNEHDKTAQISGGMTAQRTTPTSMHSGGQTAGARLKTCEAVGRPLTQTSLHESNEFTERRSNGVPSCITISQRCTNCPPKMTHTRPPLRHSQPTGACAARRSSGSPHP